MCTVTKEITSAQRLRSYDSVRPTLTEPTILQAALATSAATGLFEPVDIGSQKFVDGALRVNNPIFEVESEAADLWSPKTGDIKDLVKCIVSIGTGQSRTKAVEAKVTQLASTLISIATETEETAKNFIDRWREHYTDNRYFRFNVEQGLQNVNLAEYRDQGKISAATQQYMDHQVQATNLSNCVYNLKQKQGVYI